MGGTGADGLRQLKRPSSAARRVALKEAAERRNAVAVDGRVVKGNGDGGGRGRRRFHWWRTGQVRRSTVASEAVGARREAAPGGGEGGGRLRC